MYAATASRAITVPQKSVKYLMGLGTLGFFSSSNAIGSSLFMIVLDDDADIFPTLAGKDQAYLYQNNKKPVLR